MPSFPTAILLVAVLATLSSTASASDHIDFPESRRGPDDVGALVTDIAALFAFTSPSNPDNLVLAMNVNLLAQPSTRFSDQAEYIFRLRPVSSDAETLAFETKPEETQIICHFMPGIEARQDAMRCQVGQFDVVVPFNHSAGGVRAGTSEPEPDMKVFAGLRNDSFFLEQTMISGVLGQGVLLETPESPINLIDGFNVLSIVIELNVENVIGTGPMFAVIGETRRTFGAAQ